MLNKLAKMQKPIIILAAVLSVLTFFYSLGFSTDLYFLSYYTDADVPFMYVPGSEVYLNAQPFNRIFATLAFVMILACIPMFVFFSQSRRNYYVSNYITCSSFSAYTIVVAIIILVNAAKYKAQYLLVDFDKYKEVSDFLNTPYRVSTAIFDIGFALGIILILLALLIILNMIIKTIIMIKKRAAKAAKAQDGGQQC